MNTIEKPIIAYKSYTDRTPDNQFEKLLREILANGIDKPTVHSTLSENKDSGHKFAREITGWMLSYDLSNGIPITPIRDIKTSCKGAIGEVIAFINGARTLEELEKFGCPKVFWKDWVTEEKCAVWGLPAGDLGPGSYGPILTAMPMGNGKTFNQIDALIRQIRRAAMARTNLITTWYPPLALGDREQNSPRGAVVSPCHGNMIQFNIFPGEMHMVLYQRSSDSPVGLVYNLTEWPAFGMMISYLTGIPFTKYVHFLPDAQIYDIQFEKVQELLTRESRRLPSLYLRPQREINSIYDFRKDDFVLEDYDPHPKMNIPTVI
ncbi:MAG TPA: thymidylate synthase [Candidatus Paceibacterota bacterium]|nr:thymidylate synthase [Candidatus Paceibacterota bacterium]